MENAADTVRALERRFWESLAQQDTEAALELLSEPALMTSGHGSMQFDHATYRNMLESGAMVLNSFELGHMNVLMPSDSAAILTYDVKQVVAKRGQQGGNEQQMHDSSTWLRIGGRWKCVAHTETPATPSAPPAN
ncbi:MAG TPA: nuclear transport factor 2 family protein [Steroidobacteraceae bacterium]|nr:nuclear transport factor 2 family protein [Steroidobacteraceae bacterium]